MCKRSSLLPTIIDGRQMGDMKRTRRGFLKHGTIFTSAIPANAWIPLVHVCAADASRIKIALVGTGHPHALGKLDAVSKLAELYEVVGVVEANERRAAGLSKHPSVAKLPLMSESQLLNISGLQ